MATPARALLCSIRLARGTPSTSPICHAITTRGLRIRSRAVSVTGPEGAIVQQRLRTIESMPFQTFQLALDVIRKDREEKLEQIKVQRERLQNVLKYTGAKPTDKRVVSMVKYLEDLKVKADINNPRVKYNFDNGIIGLHKPIYRWLADKKWREMRRPILMQRITQMNVIPDVLPHIDPVVDVQVRFQGKDIQPGAFVESLKSERAPTFKVIPFSPEEMLCTVAIVDPDIPDIENDTFKYRLHWLVSNIFISPRRTQAIGTGSWPSDTITPYLPPHVQKGAPYHRYSMFVFKQPAKLDAEGIKPQIDRDTFNMRSFSAKHKLEPIGVFMFRGKWDDGTQQVMQKHGIEGWDKMFVGAKE
ncbi:mitochondrial 54S ribosomal protein YmL35 [Rhizina undulata]